MAKAIVLVNADPGKDRKVAHALKKLPEVGEVSLVSGVYDVAATVLGADAEAILSTVYDKIRPLAGVRSSHTMFCLDV